MLKFFFRTILLTAALITGSLVAEAATYVHVDDLYYSLTTTPYPGEEGVFEAAVSTPDGRVQWSPGTYEGDITIPPFFTYEGQRYAVTAVASNCFAYQTGVTAVKLPYTLRKIESYALRETQITELTLPANLESVALGMLSRCEQLRVIYSKAAVPPTAESNFTIGITPQDIQLYVPAGSVEAYKEANEWKKFTNIQVLPDEQVLPEEISVSPEAFCNYIGERFTVTATVLPENTDDKSIVWSSTDEAVATVDQEGNVVLTGAGECDIVATSVVSPSVSGSCRVESIEDTRVFPEELIINPDEVQLPVGTRFKVNVTILPEDCFDKSIEYTIVPDEGVITFDEDGYVTLLKEGMCFLTIYSALNHRVGATLSVISRPDVVVDENISYRVNPADETCVVVASNAAYSSVLELPSDILPGFSNRVFYKVVGIEPGVFSNARNINTLKLPAGIETIGENAFANSEQLTLVEVKAEVPPVLPANAFPTDLYGRCALEVPKESVNAYKEAETWKNFHIIAPIGGSGVKGIETDEPRTIYYNLQGIEIANPEKGQVVIKRAGSTTTKVIVK